MKGFWIDICEYWHKMAVKMHELAMDFLVTVYTFLNESMLSSVSFCFFVKSIHNLKN